MLTGHQKVTLRRAGFRIEDELPTTFVAILDHPTPAEPGLMPGFRIPGRLPARLYKPLLDAAPIVLPFVAFRARRKRWLDAGAERDEDVIWHVEWSVFALDSEPDDRGIIYSPQLDARGQEAMAYLEKFVAGLEPAP